MLSATMRTGEYFAMPGSRQVSSGSSASAVPMPTMMASLCARRRWTRSRTPGPVIASGLRPAAPTLPSAEIASLSMTWGRPSQHAPDMAGMIASRLVGAETHLDRNAGGAEPLMTGAGDLWIGVFKRRDDARHARRRRRRRRKAATAHNASKAPT